MEETSNNITIENILVSFNKFQYEMVKSMNYIREDIKDLRLELKGDINELRNELREFKEETNKRWEENDRRWEENEKRWEENDRRWEQNEKRWEKYESNRKEDREFVFDILTSFDMSISKQLGDPNVGKMRKSI